MSALCEVLKTDSRVDVVTEHGLAGFKVAVDDAFDGLTQKGLAEIRVALRPRPDGFFKVVVRGITGSPVSFFVCSRPNIPARPECPCSDVSSYRLLAGSRAVPHPCRNKCGSRARNRFCTHKRRRR